MMSIAMATHTMPCQGLTTKAPQLSSTALAELLQSVQAGRLRPPPPPAVIDLAAGEPHSYCKEARDENGVLTYLIYTLDPRPWDECHMLRVICDARRKFYIPE